MALWSFFVLFTLQSPWLPLRLPRAENFLAAYTPLYRGCASHHGLHFIYQVQRRLTVGLLFKRKSFISKDHDESSDLPCGFHFLGTMISFGHVQWRGELSISMWDLLDLGGLSVTGLLFDEVVPTAEYLYQSLGERARIPVSCKFLLSGYHYLVVQSLDGRVSTSVWIGYWNHSLCSYVGYEAAERSTSKIACPRRPSVLENCRWDAADRHPFDTLRVSADLEEEVYCETFLSCWLCVFVLNVVPLCFIRASVFNMASFMANGSRVSLVEAELMLLVIQTPSYVCVK
ncbi:hypothetical protein LIER_32549 [Lithospermum erythrorhizon]|uniref:Uncharacterized protein n=1 Tax=Lithospermum erythrorhizon TaxID=34254 RepID=A0AAV3S018_LITER